MEAVATAEMCEQEIDQLAAYTAIVREYSSAHGALQEYSKRVSTLDEKGNVLEDTDIDVKDGSIKGKRSFAYEFDAKGNWIKKSSSKWITKDGPSPLQISLQQEKFDMTQTVIQ